MKIGGTEMKEKRKIQVERFRNYNQSSAVICQEQNRNKESETMINENNDDTRNSKRTQQHETNRPP